MHDTTKKSRSAIHSVIVAFVVLLPGSVRAALGAKDGIDVYRTGDELIVAIDRLDVLRQTRWGLGAVVKLHGVGKEKELAVDLSDAALQGALVIDLARFGPCHSVTVTIKDAGGKILIQKTAAPIEERVIKSNLVPTATAKPASGERFAYIEPGTAMRSTGAAPPQILLPDAAQLRRVKLERPARLVSKKEITCPVVAEVDYPLVGNSVVGRQTAAPDDPGKASLYFTCKKAIYDGPALSRWQKFLVEVPIQNAWGDGQRDQTLILAPDQFEVHITNEAAPGGKNMLGAGDGDLGQKGEMDSDERGRIYWRVEGGGATIVRFDPHTKKFEQPPCHIDFQTLVPKGVGLLSDNHCKVTCTRGRVFFTMCNDTLSTGDPGNAHRRRLGGVFSIPQDWSDAAAFANDIRLHVGSWETAQPTFYKAPPKADADVRKLGACNVTEAGLFITTAGPKYEGGPWRLDLDDRGNTVVFGQVASLDAAMAADGIRLRPTSLVRVKGLPKGRELNPGPGGLLDLITFSSGEIVIPRASVRLLVQGIEGLSIQRATKHGPPIYDGAPSGTLTLRYDLVAKLRSAPQARGALADSLSGGSSLGPAFLVTPIPGEANKTIAVCEYTGYPLSILDFTNLQTRKAVSKRFLPDTVPARVGLGPYASTWLRHDDEQWLYITGYTGMARILYAKGGKPLAAATTSDPFNSRLIATPIDGHRRTSMKKIDGLIPVFGGRLIDCGYGIGGRGGDAFSTGVELFDPQQLGPGLSQTAPSQTAAHLSRCFALRTLRGRVIWIAHDGTRRQEIFAASGSVRRQFLDELGEKDKTLAPASLDAKIFCYEVAEETGLHDLFGFALPSSETGRSVEGHIVLSSCNRFLVILTQDGVLYSYAIDRKQFIDGLILTDSSGGPCRPMEFHRSSEILFTSPDGGIFFLGAPSEASSTAMNFHRVLIDPHGRLSIRPHLGITFDNKDGHKDFDGIVRCFLPDLKKQDGSYDFVMGFSQSTVAPFVRVISDFIPPR